MAKVIVAETQAERQEIYRFRYQVYVEEMQKRPSCANHQTKTITDELDKTATLLYVMQNEQIIATLRRNRLDNSVLSESLEQNLAIPQFAAAFSRSALSLSSRLMVAPAWRNSLAVGSLVLEAYRIAREQQVQFDFLHAAPWLLPFYRNLGYRPYVPHFLDPDVGLQIPQALVLEDLEYLQAVRSPFTRLARQAANQSMAPDWFQQHYPAPPELASLPISILPGLGAETLKQLSQATAVYAIPAGETILRFGDVANAMFAILAGEVEVSRLSYQIREQNYLVSTLTADQTFGETNLFSPSPSLEQAVALTDANLLILPKPALAKLTKTMPDVMCQLLLSASRSICDRYLTLFTPPTLQNVA